MNDDLDLLASAYLDDDLDGDARADVEADPAVVARIAELRTVRDAVGRFDDAAPPAAATRDRVVAAALTAFDELHAPARVAATEHSTARPPRPARVVRTRWLGAVAAATLVAAGVGAVVASVGGRGDDESAGINDAAVVVTDDGNERTELAPAATATEEEAAGGAAADMAAPDSDDTTERTAAAAAEATAPVGSLYATEATGPGVVLLGDEELAEFAGRVDADADVVAPDCDDDRFATPLAIVEFSPDTARTPVVVVVVLDPAGTTAFAVDAARCDVLAAVPVDRQG